MFLKFLRAINPLSWFLAYKTMQMRKERLSISDFAHKHKHLVVIVLDPKNDQMFMAYKDRQVLNQIKSADGVKHKVVKGVMKAGGQFNSKIDMFLVPIIELLKVPLTNPHMQDLVKWMDGAVFAIGKAVKGDKENEQFAEFINKEKKNMDAMEMAQSIKGRVGGKDLDIRVNGEKI